MLLVCCWYVGELSVCYQCVVSTYVDVLSPVGVLLMCCPYVGLLVCCWYVSVLFVCCWYVDVLFVCF